MLFRQQFSSAMWAQLPCKRALCELRISVQTVFGQWEVEPTGLASCVRCVLADQKGRVVRGRPTPRI